MTVSGAETEVGMFRNAAGAALWLAAGLMAVAFVLTFLLPRQARAEATAAH